MDLEMVCGLSKEAGYEAICMRGSQIRVDSGKEAISAACATLERHGMPVSMVTGDFATVYNNAQGPESLRTITPHLDLAEALKTTLIRVAVKHADDIPFAQRAADEANDRGLTLVHQCHTQSLFETVEGIETTLKAIDRKNFRLIYEPANLELCGQDYGVESVRRLAPWIANVYLQNQLLKPDGKVTLDPWCRGPVPFDIIPIEQVGGVSFEQVFEGLHAVGYDGLITVHQSAPEIGEPLEAACATASYLRELM